MERKRKEKEEKTVVVEPQRKGSRRPRKMMNVPEVKEDGTPKAVKSDGSLDKRGGSRPGAGRKPIHKRLSNYEKAIRVLDDSVEDALQVLVDGLDDGDKYYRVRCAELLLKKTIADKKQNEVTGPGGGPIQVSRGDWQNAIDDIDRLIEQKMEEKKNG